MPMNLALLCNKAESGHRRRTGSEGKTRIDLHRVMGVPYLVVVDSKVTTTWEIRAGDKLKFVSVVEKTEKET